MTETNIPFMDQLVLTTYGWYRINEVRYEDHEKEEYLVCIYRIGDNMRIITTVWIHWDDDANYWKEIK